METGGKSETGEEGQASCTRRLGSKEVHTVPVGGGFSVAHGGQHPPLPPMKRRDRRSSGSWGHCRAGSLTNSHMDEAQNYLGVGGVPRG